MKKVGALWSRVAKGSRKPFITGIIDRNEMPETEKVSVVVFENTNRQSDKSPNYLMFLSEPAASKAPQGGMFSSGTGEGGLIDDDDVPF